MQGNGYKRNRSELSVLDTQTGEAEQGKGERTATTVNITKRRLCHTAACHAYHAVTLYDMRYQRNHPGQCHVR